MAYKFDFPAEYFTVTESNGVITVTPAIDADGNLELAGTHDGTHLVLRDNHLWVDATGDLRIDTAAPTSDTDGVVVGTQS